MDTKIFYIFGKILVSSIIFSKFDNNIDRILKEKESIEISNILGLIKKKSVKYI